jgi:hypothetical protein
MALLYFGHFRMQYNGSSQCAVTRKQLQLGSCSVLLFGYIEYICIRHLATYTKPYELQEITMAISWSSWLAHVHETLWSRNQRRRISPSPTLSYCNSGMVVSLHMGACPFPWANFWMLVGTTCTHVQLGCSWIMSFKLKNKASMSLAGQRLLVDWWCINLRS